MVDEFIEYDDFRSVFVVPDHVFNTLQTHSHENIETIENGTVLQQLMMYRLVDSDTNEPIESEQVISECFPFHIEKAICESYKFSESDRLNLCNFVYNNAELRTTTIGSARRYVDDCWNYARFLHYIE